MSRKPSQATLDKELVEYWDRIIQLIPGYDPTANAEGCEFDYDAAMSAYMWFCEELVFVEGEKAGQPFELEEWQQAIIGNLFGWKRYDGNRRYRTAYIEIPRKNGKTPFCAGLVDYVAFEDNEPGGQYYSAAAEKEQAALVYTHAKEMIKKNPTLESSCQIFKAQKSIEFHDEDGCIVGHYRSLSADADTKHGLNAHLIIVDELHVQKNRELIDTLDTSTASRRQPLLIHITTAGFDKKTICYEIYTQACRVRDNDGADDQEFLPVIYEAVEPTKTTKGDDWTDREVWKRVNPNYGVSVKPDYLEKAFKKAQQIPAYENTFKRLHLNIWTEQETRWLQMEHWNACPDIDITEDILVGQPCYAGLDLSSRKDISSLVLLFDLPGELIHIKPFFWAPRDCARKREKTDRVPYLTWAKQGLITLTEGNVIDYHRVCETLLQVMGRYDFQQMGFDRVFFDGIKMILDDHGVPIDKLVEFGQGYLSMSGPTKEFETMVMSKRFVHCNHPVMDWMVGNAAVEMDAAGNIKPSKKLAREKIDGVVAAIMALGLKMTVPPKKPSVYEERGILTA